MNAVKKDEELNTMKLTVGLYIFVFALKLTGFFFTGVMVLLADAMHSLSDILIYSFLLVAAI